MFGYISGKVIDIEDEKIIVQLQDGLGVEVNYQKCKKDVGEEISLFLQTIARENDISVYGFDDKYSKQVFNLLLKVSGIGPKLAMSIINNLEAEAIVSMIINKDVEKLSKVKGLGKKTAEKIVFALRDKFEKDKAQIKLTGTSQKENDVIQSLIFLGYSEKVANEVVDEIYDESESVENLIKKAIVKLR